MPAVEGAEFAVRADLQQQYRDELLGHRAVGVRRARRRVFRAGAFAKVAGEGAVEAA